MNLGHEEMNSGGAYHSISHPCFKALILGFDVFQGNIMCWYGRVINSSNCSLSTVVHNFGLQILQCNTAELKKEKEKGRKESADYIKHQKCVDVSMKISFHGLSWSISCTNSLIHLPCSQTWDWFHCSGSRRKSSKQW